MTQFQSDTSRFRATILATVLLLAGAGLTPSQATAQEAPRLPLPAVDEQPGQNTDSETIVLAGGCFWGVQGVFQHV